MSPNKDRETFRALEIVKVVAARKRIEAFDSIIGVSWKLSYSKELMGSDDQ